MFCRFRVFIDVIFFCNTNCFADVTLITLDQGIKAQVYNKKEKSFYYTGLQSFI